MQHTDSLCTHVLLQGYIDRGEGDARARVFYYKCQYISGQWDYKAVDDYMWLGNEELLSHLDASLADLTRNICDAKVIDFSQGNQRDGGSRGRLSRQVRQMIPKMAHKSLP